MRGGSESEAEGLRDQGSEEAGGLEDQGSDSPVQSGDESGREVQNEGQEAREEIQLQEEAVEEQVKVPLGRSTRKKKKRSPIPLAKASVRCKGRGGACDRLKKSWIKQKDLYAQGRSSLDGLN
ncbi:hypothetical protein DY000_02020169 [Brassica cretica]|uniref:Uncharacterized protein n=1 Tax=Brassica cretica TaxID=69181 RepID=A0ABQ7EB43_BRACR|nr:hypothetical protein DY000_02020169 [Brassica cretica]